MWTRTVVRPQGSLQKLDDELGRDLTNGQKIPLLLDLSWLMPEAAVLERRDQQRFRVPKTHGRRYHKSGTISTRVENSVQRSKRS